jgi:uncharacterized protein YegL
MKNNTTLYNFILDRSGSMSGMEQMAVEGFNNHLSTIKNLKKEFPKQQFLCSLTTFNDEINTIVSIKSIDEIKQIEVGQYRPEGMTALLDAIGKNIHDVNEKFQKQIDANEMSVVFVIITDGYENASRFFSYHDIAKKIADLEKTEKWTFTFLGADFDAVQTSQMLNIKRENSINFKKSNYKEMMTQVDEQMYSYSYNKECGVVQSCFFDDNKKNKK